MERFYSTKRLYLRNLDESAAAYVLTFYDENRQLFEPWEPLHPSRFYTMNYQTSLLSAERNLTRRSQAIRYYMFEKEHSDKIIGSINFYHIMRSPDWSCKLGYKLAAAAWHKGYAYEAISYLIPKIFQDYNLHRIELDIMPSNSPSLKLAQRLNFTYEGVARKAFEVNGNWQDHYRLALLSTDPMPRIVE